MRKGLISVVGVDGAGKTTQAKYIADKLNEMGLRAAYWKSPSFDWVRSSMRISGGDQNGEDVWTDALTFALAHRQEQYLIRDLYTGEIHKDFLEDKGVVRMLEGQQIPTDILVGQRGIIDFFSFLMTEGMNIDELNGLLKPNLNWNGHNYKPTEFISPDAIIYLDCSPEVSMGRIPREDKWEEVPFLKKLVKTYEALFQNMPPILKGTNIIRVNSEPPIAEVQKEIDKEVIPKLEQIIN